MKKHVTIAMLLAAGTSLANAATANFTFNSPIDGATNVTVESQSIGDIVRTIDEIFAGANVTISQNGVQWTSLRGEISSAFSVLGNEAALSALSEATGVSVEALKSVKGGVGSFAHTYLKAPISVSFSGLEANTEYSISTIFQPLANKDWEFSVTGGEFISGSYGLLSRTYDTWEEFNGTLLADGTINARGVSFTARTDATGTLSFSTGAPAEIGFLSIAAIPEPSAFGLLAGAGALALVASRRRRK